MRLADQPCILVTGADGFIGSHLVEALARAGCRVRALALYNAEGRHGWLEALPPALKPAVEVVLGDVRDPASAAAAVKGASVVFHLAALIAIPYSYQAPQSYVDTNVTGTLVMLQAARAAGVARFVHTSTSEVYGTAQSVPIAETHPLNAQSPYAATKVAADQMALACHRSFGVPVTVVRPFNAYGPRQSARGVIPSIIVQALAGRDRIRLGALHPTRDFTFVADTAAGFMALAEADAAVGEVTNLGTGFEISIADLLALVGEILVRPLAPETAAERLRPAPSEVERLVASSEKAHRLAGWRAAHTGRDGLKRGLAATCAWFADPAHLARYKADLYGV